MTAKENIKRLQVYLEKCEQQHKDAKNEHIKAFMAREITRTKAKMAKLAE